MFVDKGYYRYVIASETAPTFYGYIDITGANSPTALPLNSWQYTTMTWNGSVIKVYENGAYKGQTNKADAITTDNNDLRFGNHYTNSSYFDGFWMKYAFITGLCLRQKSIRRVITNTTRQATSPQS